MFYTESKKLSGSDLKWLAIIAMLIDHIGAFILEPYAMSGLGNDKIADLATLTRLVGRIAFPIFAFLLVEGFIHTRNFKKYLSQIGLFALISEIPFNLAAHGKILDFSHQNIYFTLFLGLLTLASFDYFKEKTYVKWLSLVFFMGLAIFLKTDYAALGIGIIFAFAYFRQDIGKRNLVLFPLLLLQATAILALVPLGLYNGKRGRQNKFFFYIFYPAHLLILFFIRNIFFTL